MAITGLNHITLAVADLDRALEFYCDLLGARQATRADGSAYLELGTIWLCLERSATVSKRADDTHIALSCAPDAFDALAERITVHAPLWKQNRSEGASIYFLDPDGHKLELHQGDLGSRLAHYRGRPDLGVKVL